MSRALGAVSSSRPKISIVQLPFFLLLLLLLLLLLFLLFLLWLVVLWRCVCGLFLWFVLTGTIRRQMIVG